MIGSLFFHDALKVLYDKQYGWHRASLRCTGCSFEVLSDAVLDVGSGSRYRSIRGPSSPQIWLSSLSSAIRRGPCSRKLWIGLSASDGIVTRVSVRQLWSTAFSMLPPSCSRCSSPLSPWFVRAVCSIVSSWLYSRRWMRGRVGYALSSLPSLLSEYRYPSCVPSSPLCCSNIRFSSIGTSS